MSNLEERDEKVKAAYAKLKSALEGALEWKDYAHCETPLLGCIREWSEAECELKELHVCEGYYKAVLDIIFNKVTEHKEKTK